MSESLYGERYKLNMPDNVRKSLVDVLMELLPARHESIISTPFGDMRLVTIPDFPRDQIGFLSATGGAVIVNIGPSAPLTPDNHPR